MKRFRVFLGCITWKEIIQVNLMSEMKLISFFKVNVYINKIIAVIIITATSTY